MTSAVYDTMIFFQWAALPPERSHASVRAVRKGVIRLCLSAEIVQEVRALLIRPNIRAKSRYLTLERVDELLDEIRRDAEWFTHVGRHFSYPAHVKDDHILNLAIESKARYLVTWENRLQKLAISSSEDARTFRQLAPDLIIISPAELAKTLKV